MHTGDLAIMDGQGYCSIVGRIKDMVRGQLLGRLLKAAMELKSELELDWIGPGC